MDSQEEAAGRHGEESCSSAFHVGALLKGSVGKFSGKISSIILKTKKRTTQVCFTETEMSRYPSQMG